MDSAPEKPRIVPVSRSKPSPRSPIQTKSTLRSPLPPRGPRSCQTDRHLSIVSWVITRQLFCETRTKRRPPAHPSSRLRLCHRWKVVVPRAEHDLSLKLRLTLRHPHGVSGKIHVGCARWPESSVLPPVGRSIRMCTCNARCRWRRHEGTKGWNQARLPKPQRPNLYIYSTSTYLLDAAVRLDGTLYALSLQALPACCLLLAARASYNTRVHQKPKSCAKSVSLSRPAAARSAALSPARASSPKMRPATSRFCSCSCMMRSSTVSATARRNTRTSFCWPMRCTRSHAWSSANGFHQGSHLRDGARWVAWGHEVVRPWRGGRRLCAHMTTVLAHVRLRPTPHLSDMSSTGTPGSWKRITWPRIMEVRPRRP